MSYSFASLCQHQCNIVDPYCFSSSFNRLSPLPQNHLFQHPQSPPAPLDDNMDAELKDDDEDDDEGDDEGEEVVDDLRRDADKKSVSPDSFGDGAKKGNSWLVFVVFVLRLLKES